MEETEPNWQIAAGVTGALLLTAAVACGGDSTTNDSTDAAATNNGIGASNTTAASASGSGSGGTAAGSGPTSVSTTFGDSGGSGGSSSASSSADSGGSAATSGGAATSGATSTSGGAGGASAQSLCPEAVPSNGSECSEPWIDQTSFPGAHCAWGEDPRPRCRTRGVCSSGFWTIVEPDTLACAEPPLPEQCPSTPAPNGSACEMANLECWYDDGTRCVCSPCLGGSEYPVCGFIDPPEWACITPGAGCPNPLPSAGDTCDQEQACGLDCELPIVCSDGVWQWGQNTCPICAAPDTPIATPSGERPMASLSVGDLVYSVEDEAVVAVPILRVASTPVARHHVMRVTLTDGSVLEISPGHPTADRRSFADLVTGSALDESHRVLSAERVPYRYDRTYDILPSTKSGTYFAAGALIGSTLARP